MAREDIVAELKKRKISLRSLGLANGLSQYTLKNALDKPYKNGEAIIAAALERKPEDIWPSRYKTAA
ncbi:helix-turn-helix domain-containing protein [Photobacterium damselae]|uniref:helix-turn-helix domain-containing protein n=1 Tax=Photobacterium damselae TaxID=38293 RepID=UPI003AAB4263